MPEALTAMKCWCGPGGCRRAYNIEDGEPSTFVCKWCRCPTPWCCGGDGDKLDQELCDRCWCERHPDIEAEIERESREMEVAHA